MMKTSTGDYIFAWIEDRDWRDSLETLDAVLDGSAAEGFGTSMSGAGDINGDGYNDLMVGVPLNDIGGADAGAVYIYYGSPSGYALDDTPDMILVGSDPGDQFGFAVTGGTYSDFNGDGKPDIAVGAPYNDAGGADAGRVYVFYGGESMDTNADLIMTGEGAGDNFGYALAGMNTSLYGYISYYGPDLIVGAPLNDSAGSNAGRVYVYSGYGGGDNVADAILDGEAAGDHFGETVLQLSTYANGYGDIAVGAPYNAAGGTDAGRVYLYFGNDGTLTVAEHVFTGEYAGDRFGSALARYPSYYDDLIVGAPYSDAAGSDAGAVYFYYMGYYDTLDTAFDAVWIGENANDRFGSSVAGDGPFGVVIGAPLNDAGGNNAGRAYLYFSDTHLDTTADITITGEAAEDQLGYSLAVVNDITGDYQRDLLIGAPYHDPVSSDEGRVYVYSGGSAPKIYGQKVNHDGTPQWSVDGIVLNDNLRYYSDLHLVSDGQDGALLAWTGYDDLAATSYNIYASRIDGSGSQLWEIPVEGDSNYAYFDYYSYDGNVATDSSGNLFLTWKEYFYDTENHYDIKTSKVDPNGNLQWGAGGIDLDDSSSYDNTYYYSQYYHALNGKIASDNAGGAIITWTGYNDVLVQRVDSAGNIVWNPGGLDVGDGSIVNYSYPTPIGMNNGGALVAWNTYPGYDIVGKNISSTGVPGSLLTICNDSASQYYPKLVKTSDGSAVVTWSDSRNSSTNSIDIYAQKINPAGQAQWTANGVGVETTGANTYYNGYDVVSDGYGGVIVSWADNYTSGIYAHRLKDDGTAAWPSGPVRLSSQISPAYPRMAPDGEGGAVVSWIDYRNGNYDIFAQNVDRHGYLGLNDPDLTSAADVPADQGGRVGLIWESSYLDQYPSSVISYYSVWRGINPSAVPAGAVFLKPGDVPSQAGGPAIRYRTTSGGAGTAWEWIADLPAHYLGNYSYSAPTLADSTGGGTPMFQFFISAQTTDPFVFWDSDIDSAYSVDNLAPSPPSSLTAEAVGGTSIQLDWNSTTEPDLAGYLVHRSSEEGFTPGEGTLLAQTADTLLNDPSPALGKNYYTVIGVDIHGNLGSPSPEASSALAYGITASAGSSGMIAPSGNVVVLAGGDQAFTITPAEGYHVDSLLVDGAPVDSTVSYTFSAVSDMHMIEARFAQTPSVVVTEAKSGWNLVSVPVTVADYSTSLLLPTAVTTPYTFSGGSYTQQTTLANGPGYWVKFSGEESVGITGFDRTEESIAVEEGWNMVGSISTPTAVTSIGSDPPGIVTSQFYGYDGTYFVSPVVQPGQGYWVKASQGGTLHLVAGSGIPASNTIRIVPTEETPPPPPGSVWSDGLVPDEYVLEQNYPNPFNPVTTIRYALPEAGMVRIVVYSTLGEEVATIVDEHQEAGYREVSFNAASLPSGVYSYRLTANATTIARKMIILK